MTPLPKPTPTLRRMRADNPIPMTNAAYLRWRNRRPATPMAILTPEEVGAAIAKIQGRPYWRDTVEPASEGTTADEVDAAYLAAIRQAHRLVGTAAGQVPMEVAGRLYDAGLIRKVATGE